MAVFIGRISKERIKAEFTHYGLMYGFIPVYIGHPYGICRVAVRNGWPDWLLDFGDLLFEVYATFQKMMDPHFEPMFFFKLGKLIHADDSTAL